MTSSNAAQPLALRFTDVSKSFGGTQALRRVSFDVAVGSVHALCGGNGSGKSTLLKILAGVHQADAGWIEVAGEKHAAERTTPPWARDCGLHFVHQAVGTFAEMTVAENFALAAGFGAPALAPVPWRQLHARVQSVLDRFELEVDARQRISDLRPATRTMVAVARALQHEKEPGRDILVLDEPTASLPAHEAELVLDAIRGHAARGQTVIFVTHRLPEVLEVATDATFLRDGAHLETRSTQGLGERDLVERIAGHPLPEKRSRSPRAVDEGRLEISDLSAGGLDGLCLSVGAGEVVGISGLLGSGRSTLLQALFGARRVSGGTVTVDGERFAPRSPAAAISAGVAYIPEDRAGEGAFNDLGVRVNLSAPALRRYWSRIRIKRRAEAAAARRAIADYSVVVRDTEVPMSSMSGGNQQKVVLARWLELSPRVLLLDEPTQGVDVGARDAIHEQIRRAARDGMSVLVVSSDPEELVQLCDRVVGLANGRVVGQAAGPQLTIHRCIELAYGIQSVAQEDKELLS